MRSLSQNLSSKISKNELKSLESEIRLKAEILEKGYKKRGKNKELNELRNLLTQPSH